MDIIDRFSGKRTITISIIFLLLTWLIYIAFPFVMNVAFCFSFFMSYLTLVVITLRRTVDTATHRIAQAKRSRDFI